MISVSHTQIMYKRKVNISIYGVARCETFNQNKLSKVQQIFIKAA